MHYLDEVLHEPDPFFFNIDHSSFTTEDTGMDLSDFDLRRNWGNTFSERVK
jgi:hypothetical protein